MLGQIELIKRGVRAEFALEFRLRSHLFQFSIDERSIFHVVFQCRLGLLLVQHDESVDIELRMKCADVRAHVRQTIRSRAAVRTQVGLPTVTHQMTIVARGARRLVAAVRTAPYFRTEMWLLTIIAIIIYIAAAADGCIIGAVAATAGCTIVVHIRR